jgi:hypothetical protein
MQTSAVAAGPLPRVFFRNKCTTQLPSRSKSAAIFREAGIATGSGDITRSFQVDRIVLALSFFQASGNFDLERFDRDWDCAGEHRFRESNGFVGLHD